ncbi:MAG: sigma-70 family RNA polymerase sigma factor [Bacillota bacterium]
MAGKRLDDAQAIVAAQEDSAALEALLPEAEKLVWGVFWRCVGRDRLVATCLEPQDLYQQGMVGFLRAVERYDAARGVPFVHYAASVILGEMRQLLRSGFAVKLPRTLADVRSRVKVAREHFLATRGREPTVDELAGRLGFRTDRVSDVLAMQATVSLDAPARSSDDEELCPMERVAADDSWQERVEARVDLELLLSRLSERDRMIVRLRARGLQQRQIAEKLGITQQAISRRVLAIRRHMAWAS